MREDNEDGGGRRFGGPRRGGFQRNSMPPVRVGEELDVVIEAVGEKGDGIAKKNGFVLFVPGVNEGDNVRIRVTKVFRKVGFAEVVGEGSAREEAPAGEKAPEESESFGEEEEASEEKTSEDEPSEESEETEETEEFGGEE